MRWTIVRIIHHDGVKCLSFTNMLIAYYFGFSYLHVSHGSDVATLIKPYGAGHLIITYCC